MPHSFGNTDSDDGVTGTSTTGRGVAGESVEQAGVIGTSTNFVGVWGESQSPASAGQPGVFGKSPNWQGVHGESTAQVGVHGISANFVGVWGESKSHSTAQAPGQPGVFGVNTSGGDGIVGQASNTSLPSTPQPASGTGGRGVVGTSDTQAGVVGTSKQFVGVWGESQSDSQPGVFGKGPTLAGRFEGDVLVKGQAFINPQGGVIPKPLGTGLTVVASPNEAAILAEGANVGNAATIIASTNSSSAAAVAGRGPLCGVFGFAVAEQTEQEPISGPDVGISGRPSGVIGESHGDNFNGVCGVATGNNGWGLFGFAQNTEQGTGVVGTTSAAAGVGVSGQNLAGGLAGSFSGHVRIEGNLTVTGTKSALVKDAHGVDRLLYAVESPESWFEDFGEGTIESGSGTVILNEDFATLVRTDRYYVFLTPKGDSQGLFVESKLEDHFTVREQNGGKNILGFDYRVVARRRDVEAKRLDQVTMRNLCKPGVNGNACVQHS